MNHRRTFIAVALSAGTAACLTAGGCSGNHGNAASSLGAVAGSPSATAASAATSSPGQAGGFTPGAASTHGTSGGTATTTLPTITVKVNRLPTVKTDNCPYTFDVQGLISVSAGPIDLTYGWQDGPGQPVHDSKKIHFGGTGAQSKPVALAVAAIGIQKEYTENLVVLDHLYTASPGTVTFTIICGTTVSAPAPANPNVTCGGKTTFSALVHTAVTHSVQGQWHFSDGSASGAFVIAATSPDAAVDSALVTINRNPADLRGRFSATLTIDDQATDEHLTATGYVICTLVAKS